MVITTTSLAGRRSQLPAHDAFSHTNVVTVYVGIVQKIPFLLNHDSSQSLDKDTEKHRVRTYNFWMDRSPIWHPYLCETPVVWQIFSSCLEKILLHSKASSERGKYRSNMPLSLSLPLPPPLSRGRLEKRLRARWKGV